MPLINEDKTMWFNKLFSPLLREIGLSPLSQNMLLIIMKFIKINIEVRKREIKGFSVKSVFLFYIL